MPSSVTILCQIRSKGQEGGFISGLANYTIQPGISKVLHYGFYKKQISVFLYDLKIADYILLCGKCVFNRGIMHVLVSAAFKLPIPDDSINELFPASPYASFVGRIYEAVEQYENDCKFGVTLLEYNNFSFASKSKMDFKIQVVYEAGPDSRFKKLITRLNTGKLVFISGFFDLNENELPFIEAKEIDLLDEFSNNPTQNQANTSLQSPFSRTNKFKTNKNRYTIQQTVKNTVSSSGVRIVTDNSNEQARDNNIRNEDEMVIASTSTSTSALELNEETSEKPRKNKRKELADLSIQKLKKSARKTNVMTRSQKEDESDDLILIEPENNE